MDPRLPIRRALLVLVPATVDVAVAAGVVIGRADPGYALPTGAALAGVAVTVAAGLVAMLRGRVTGATVLPAVPVPLPPVPTPPGDEYVDTLLADLAL